MVWEFTHTYCLQGLNMKDLSKRHSDYATFLPAISGFFTELLGRCNSVEGYIPNVDGKDRVPQGFEHGFAGMNFLDKEKGYYYYDKALYSACLLYTSPSPRD